MSDYTKRKPNPHGSYPLDNEALPTSSSNVGSGFSRLEQWITVERLKDEFLFGIPLVSLVTKQQLKDEVIKTIITKAAGRVELKCKIDVFPVVRVVRQAYDRVKMTQGFNQIDVGVRNIRELLEISIRTANSYNEPSNNSDPNNEGTVLYNFPLEWIDPSLMRKGLIHFVPLQSAANGLIPGGLIGGTSAPLFQVLTQLTNIPGYFFIRYASGWEENAIPSVVNDLIGTYAAMEILSLLGPTNKWNSQSIGIDGASQGVSGPGNQIFALRMQELEKKAAELEDLIKSYFTNKIFMRHI